MTTQSPQHHVFKNPPSTGVRHFLHALRYSLQGLGAAVTYETAFRQELFFFVLLAPCAFYIGNNLLETGFLLMVLMNVLAIELLNSALESIVNKTVPEFDELAGRAKDMGSAAVFISLTVVVVVWTLMLIKNVF